MHFTTCVTSPGDIFRRPITILRLNDYLYLISLHTQSPLQKVKSGKGREIQKYY